MIQHTTYNIGNTVDDSSFMFNSSCVSFVSWKSHSKTFRSWGRPSGPQILKLRPPKKNASFPRCHRRKPALSARSSWSVMSVRSQKVVAGLGTSTSRAEHCGNPTWLLWPFATHVSPLSMLTNFKIPTNKVGKNQGQQMSTVMNVTTGKIL